MLYSIHLSELGGGDDGRSACCGDCTVDTQLYWVVLVAPPTELTVLGDVVLRPPFS